MSRRGIPRLVDAGLALAGLGVAAPVLAVAGAIIRATSPGPAVFQQVRVGLHGEPFKLYKLRTMRPTTSGSQVTAKGDARITPIGRFLRKTKLDELPELWNVVKGDMALVGFRPEVARYVDLSNPLWQEALRERPGLAHPVTLAFRNEEEFLARAPGDPAAYYEEVLLPLKLRACVDYARSRTWQSDVKVLFDTVLAVAVPSLSPPPSLEDVEAAMSGAIDVSLLQRLRSRAREQQRA